MILDLKLLKKRIKKIKDYSWDEDREGLLSELVPGMDRLVEYHKKNGLLMYSDDGRI